MARSLFSATSDRVGRPVTVTVFPPLSDGRTRARFDVAAATAQRLGAHPSVITIHDWGHATDGRPWIVTEPQPAESVDMLLTLDGPLEVERALQVGVLLAGALETAHRAGILHGDLSPARLVFGANGEPLLAETGLAEFAVFPGLGALNNPVRYHAPPEVLERTEISPATDVYSLATMVYALLAGRAPQQKPAEITDSNASLLLRVLQMPVPPIDRPDVPPGLDGALRGALSPSPDKRPQQAIEVAWLLQDVQRRAGYAVTEPVVLDLDDLEAGAFGAAPTVFPPADETSPPAFAPDDPARTGAWAPEPWAPAAQPPSDPAWPAPLASPALPGEPTLPAAPDTGTPPPIDVPFAAGLGAAPPSDGPTPDATVPGAPDDALWPPSGPFTEPPPDHTWPAHMPTPPPTEPDWPPTGPFTEPPPDHTWPAHAPTPPPTESLWPSTWPADPSPAEAPLWAVPPAHGGPGRVPDPAVAVGDDGGSIDDLGGRPPSGTRGAAALGAVGRPPELDELPAWYTDPLPNAGDRRGPTDNGRGPAPGATSPPSPGSAHTIGNGHGEHHDDPSPGAAGIDEPPADHGPPGGWAPLVEGPPAGGAARLPGAGDDLRSLFGQVVGDDADTEPPAPGAAGVGPHLGPLLRQPDPFGHPRDRPPIDFNPLDIPLGPPPNSSPRESAAPQARGPATPDDRRQGASGGLARRHERQSRQSSPTPTPRDRAIDAPRAIRPVQGRPSANGDAPITTERPAGPERSAPRQVAPLPDRTRDAAAGNAAAAGPPALPLMVLIGLVAVLALGVAWLVITGDDAEAPASDGPSAGGAPSVAVPTGVLASQVPEGIQVTWTGDSDASYVVTILSPDQAPQALPATTGTSVLVPNVQVASGGGRCFTVAAAPDPKTAPDPQTSSAPACTPGASIEGMRAS